MGSAMAHIEGERSSSTHCPTNGDEVLWVMTYNASESGSLSLSLRLPFFAIFAATARRKSFLGELFKLVSDTSQARPEAVMDPLPTHAEVARDRN